jgi:ABC-type cobalamin/Fe3+-siderophores transport system ATPase subunit
MTLSAQNLTFSHGPKPALFDVSATFERQKFSVILGPNGAGKSTLLACLAGLQKPDSGESLLGDLPAFDISAKARAKAIGVLPQGAETHWAINAEALVALGRYPHQQGFGLSPADKTAIDAAMAATATSDFKGRAVTQLSGGERARVLMARVLAGKPQWILADEPLANLDPSYQIDTLTLLRAQANQGVGVIAVLHDLHHAARYADQIILLHEGRVFMQGAPREVLTKSALAAVYGIDADLTTSENGALHISIKGRVGP